MTDDILERTKLSNFADFLMNGSEAAKIDHKRDILKRYQQLEDNLKKYVPSEDELGAILSQINSFNGITNDAYFQCGMSAGAKVVHQLLYPLEK